MQLETTEKTKDTTNTYYEAKTDSFSSFAIIGLKGETVSVATPSIEATPAIETPIPEAVPKKKWISGFEVIATIAILSAVYLFERKRRW